VTEYDVMKSWKILCFHIYNKNILNIRIKIMMPP